MKLNGQQVLEEARLPGIPKSGRIALEPPRIGFNSHQGFVEIGAINTKQLRQTRSIEFHAWTSPKAIKEVKSKPKPKRDPLRLARYYQSLLDTGKFESRAALARHLGVSRARVT